MIESQKAVNGKKEKRTWSICSKLSQVYIVLSTAATTSACLDVVWSGGMTAQVIGGDVMAEGLRSDIESDICSNATYRDYSTPLASLQSSLVLLETPSDHLERRAQSPVFLLR